MNDDFSELLWDNGPVVLQAPWKSSLHTTYSHASRVEERDSKGSTYPHIRPIEPKANFHQPSGFSAGFGVHALEDDVDPWNYAVAESLPNGYSPENLTDYSDINPNCIDSAGRSSCLGRANRGSNDVELGNGSEPSRIVTKSRTIGSSFGGTDNADEDQDGEGLKSPTHFLAPLPLDVGKREGSNNKARAAVPSNPVEPTLIESRSCPKSWLENQDRPVLKLTKSELGSSAKLPQEKTTGRNFTISPDQIQSSSFASNDHNHREKRRMHHKGEEFGGYQSEDVEGEPLLLKKKPSSVSRGKSTKRNRAAEVHNLSERRRRDRINEKMRALRELVPNCNKTDRASMLEDAIEYLKTLQMQVQIMSTGGGLCVHPMMMMMMQHIRGAAMSHLSPIGAGTGTGMGYGMGMYKVDDAPLCHFVPAAPFRHLPGASVLPMLGNPGQRFPVSMAHQGPATSAPCPATSSPAAALSSKDQLQQHTSLENILKD